MSQNIFPLQSFLFSSLRDFLQVYLFENSFFHLVRLYNISTLDELGLFIAIRAQIFSGAIKLVKTKCAVIPSSVYLTKIFFYHEYFDSYI